MLFQLYGTLQNLTPQPKVTLNLPESPTLLTALETLVQRYPQLKSALFEPAGNLRADLPIFLNGRNPRLFPAAMNQRVEMSDVISVFSPIASGRMNVEVLRNPSFDR